MTLTNFRRSYAPVEPDSVEITTRLLLKPPYLEVGHIYVEDNTMEKATLTAKQRAAEVGVDEADVGRALGFAFRVLVARGCGLRECEDAVVEIKLRRHAGPRVVGRLAVDLRGEALRVVVERVGRGQAVCEPALRRVGRPPRAHDHGLPREPHPRARLRRHSRPFILCLAAEDAEAGRRGAGSGPSLRQ